MIPKELIKEFIGKEVVILMFEESFGVKGKIIEIQDNWVKVEEKKRIRVINGDMIKEINMVK